MITWLWCETQVLSRLPRGRVWKYASDSSRETRLTGPVIRDLPLQLGPEEDQ